jgi:hypothetical protein
MTSIGLSKVIETTTRVLRAAEPAATPRETSAQTGISSVNEPETTLKGCALQFLVVYVPVLLSEYLLLYIGELGH